MKISHMFSMLVSWAFQEKNALVTIWVYTPQYNNMPNPRQILLFSISIRSSNSWCMISSYIFAISIFQHTSTSHSPPNYQQKRNINKFILLRTNSNSNLQLSLPLFRKQKGNVLDSSEKPNFSPSSKFFSQNHFNQ